MEPPDVWVQSGGRQRGQTIVTDQGINERKQAVYSVSGRSPRARYKPEILSLLFEHVLEHREVDLAAQTFHSPDRVKRLLEPATLGNGRAIAELVD